MRTVNEKGILLCSNLSEYNKRTFNNYSGYDPYVNGVLSALSQ